MAVISAELHWTGTTGSISRPSKREYTAVYKVETNDAKDGAAVIWQHFRSDEILPYLGAGYTYGNDVDQAAILNSINPVREEGSDTKWLVTLQYASEDGSQQQQQDSNGNPTDNPVEFRPTINISHQFYTVPVYRSLYLNGLTGAAATKRAANTYGPVHNSAFSLFDPPAEKEAVRTIVRINRNYLYYNGDEADQVINTVNSDVFTIAALNYQKTVFAFGARMTAFDGSLRYFNSFYYYALNIEMTIDDWREEILDRGTHARAAVGDPDGKGDVIISQDIVPGMPHTRRLRDIDDAPITDEVLFDGDGKPLAPGSSPVYLSYLHYDKWDWRYITPLQPFLI